MNVRGGRVSEQVYRWNTTVETNSDWATLATPFDPKTTPDSWKRLMPAGSERRVYNARSAAEEGVVLRM